MPIIHVELVEGRTKEQKKQLGEAITKAAVDIVNVPADAVKVIFVDMKKDDKGSKDEIIFPHHHLFVEDNNA